MGLLRNQAGEEISLFDEHLIGRSSTCDTSVSNLGTSSRHALIYFEGGDWWIRDLGSTNGTLLNRRPIAPGEPWQLAAGDRLALAEAEFVVLDCCPPSPVVICLETRELQVGDESFIELSRDGQAIASVYCENGVRWWLDDGGRLSELEDGAVFEFGGRRHRFFAGRVRQRTARRETTTPRIAEAELHFQVSLDEEHVSLTVRAGTETVELGTRSHHHALLELARQRQRDRQTGALPAASHGWVDSDDLVARLGSNPTKLSVEICRIRQQFSKAGFGDAADIVERRRGTGQMRIGTEYLIVESV